MASITTNIQWIPLIVGAVLAFILGWLWYSPWLFGKRWAEALGIELGSASSMPMGAMATQAIGLLGLAWAATLLSGDVWLWGLIVLAVAFLNFSGGMFGKTGPNANWVNVGYFVATGVLLWVVNIVL